MFADGHLHFRDMTQRVPVVEDAQNFTVLADEETDAARKVTLRHAYAVDIGNIAFSVGEQGEGETKFFCKPLMTGDGITADAHDFHPFLDESTDVITETTGLLGAAGSIVLRVKIQDHSLHRGFGKGVGKIPSFIGLIRGTDLGRQGAGFQNLSSRGVYCDQNRSDEYNYIPCHAYKIG